MRRVIHGAEIILGHCVSSRLESQCDIHFTLRDLRCGVLNVDEVKNTSEKKTRSYSG